MWQGCFDCVSPPNKDFVYTLNFCIREGKKKHSEDYFHTNISQWECFLKESIFTKLIFNLKMSNGHAKYLKRGTVIFLSLNNYEAKLEV